MNDRGDLDHLADPLWIAFSILERSLSDSSAALYLREGPSKKYVLYQASAEDSVFVQAIPATVVSKYFSGNEDTGEKATATVRADDTAKFIADSSKPAVRLQTLATQDKVQGLLAVALRREDQRAEDFIELAAQIVQNNLVLETQFKLIHAENTFLSDLVRKAGTLDLSSTTEAVIDTLAELVKSVLAFDCLTVSLQSAEVKEKLKIEGIRGESHGYTTGDEFNMAQVLHGEVHRQAAEIVTGDMQESSYQGRFAKGDFKKSDLRSFMGVPILVAGIARGTVAIESRSEDAYHDKDLEYLQTIVQIYGTALCWFQRYQEAHAMATVDGLTQLLNHRSFMERFTEEVERASRYGGAITFLMLDLDHFKQVNDTYGHLHGDYVLWQTSQLIRSCIRKADIAGRYGGEEFGVIIINAGKQESLTTAERIRQTIADFKYKKNGIENRISASIGMAEYPLDGHDVNTLILRADQAMYAVKRRGGNKVISYNEDIRKENE